MSLPEFRFGRPETWLRRMDSVHGDATDGITNEAAQAEATCFGTLSATAADGDVPRDLPATWSRQGCGLAAGGKEPVSLCDVVEACRIGRVADAGTLETEFRVFCGTGPPARGGGVCSVVRGRCPGCSGQLGMAPPCSAAGETAWPPGGVAPRAPLATWSRSGWVGRAKSP